MPKPKKGETERKFLSRCIPELIHEGKPQRQSIAVCFSIYRSEGTEPASPKPNKNNPKKLSKKDKAEVYCAVCQ